MKAKKLVAASLTISLLFGASGCGRIENTSNSESQTITPSPTLVSSIESPSNIPAPQTLAEASMEAYEKFLNNEAAVSVERYMPKTSLDEAMYEKGHDYTLSEMLKTITSYFSEGTEPTKVSYIDYGYIDSGKDGTKELVLRFNGLDIYDDTTLAYVIKYIDGKLYLCYDYMTWARCATVMNEYGYYLTSGSGGASNHSYEQGFIDKDGNRQFIVFVEMEQNINQLAYTDNLKQIPYVAEAKGLTANIQVDTICFDENSTERYYTFYVADDNWVLLEDASIYSNSIYKDIFDEASVPFLTPDKVQAMIQEKEQRLGITQEIKDGAEVEWKPLNGNLYSEYVGR